MPLVKNAKVAPAAAPSQTDAMLDAAAAKLNGTPPAPATAPAAPPPYRSPADAKDRRISRQGLFQAALLSPAVMREGGKTFKSFLERVREAADAGLEYVNA